MNRQKRPVDTEHKLMGGEEDGESEEMLNKILLFLEFLKKYFPILFHLI